MSIVHSNYNIVTLWKQNNNNNNNNNNNLFIFGQWGSQLGPMKKIKRIQTSLNVLNACKHESVING
jgi:hypothetical protein